MQPLTLDDLVPLDEFASQRREYFQTHRRYIDHYRRVRIGPLVTLVFENRQTLWFRVQEVLRIARLEEPAAVQQELDVFNLLLPAPGQLQAAFLIEVNEHAPLTEQLMRWRDMCDRHISLCLGQARVHARITTCRPEDRCIGASHWLQFDLKPTEQRMLADFREPAWIELTLPEYREASGMLAEDVRQSLVDDLPFSGQIRAAA